MVRGPDQKPEKSLKCTISRRRPSGPSNAMKRTPARIATKKAASARRALLTSPGCYGALAPGRCRGGSFLAALLRLLRRGLRLVGGLARGLGPALVLRR